LACSGTRQDFDCLAAVHRPVAGGGLVEREFEVEDFAGLIWPVQVRSIRSGRNRRTGAGPPRSWTWEKNSFDAAACRFPDRDQLSCIQQIPGRPAEEVTDDGCIASTSHLPVASSRPRVMGSHADVREFFCLVPHPGHLRRERNRICYE
jgi:hypothetical protein